jgi:hypothetical protein
MITFAPAGFLPLTSFLSFTKKKKKKKKPLAVKLQSTDKPVRACEQTRACTRMRALTQAEIWLLPFLITNHHLW